jgi:hypothetical protein
LISLRFLISWLALVCLGANSNASEQSFGDGADEFGAPAISVSEGDWGNVNRAEIHDVLVATARELQMFFPERHGDAIRVERSTRAPTVLYQRNAEGEYVVYLTVTGRRWEQYTYEFAHELCHIYGNHHQRPNSALAPHQWFEESLCETASLFVLRRMGLTWHARGFEQRNYAPIFAEYAKLLMNEVHRQGPLALGPWYAHNATRLLQNPYGTVSPVLNIPMRWVTEITHVKDLQYFVDEQRVGPYRIWHHEHHLKQIEGGVEMTDIVTYQPPMGILGSLANILFIRKQLKSIFEFREKKLIELFGEMR